MKSWSRRLKTWLPILALAYMGAGVVLWAVQRHLIFTPTRTLNLTPRDFGAEFEVVSLPGQLYGWWLPPRRVDSPVILYLHGAGGNISSNAMHASQLNKLGYGVLIFDYRGYGQSSGDFPSEQSVYEDSQTAWKYLTQGQQIDPKRIIVYGHSLGGAIAIDLASKEKQIRGMVLESTFTTLANIAQWRYRVYPVKLFLNQTFDSITKIRGLKIPLLFIHGTSDFSIPDSMSAELFEASPGDKALVRIEGAGHSNCGATDPKKYYDAFTAFVEKVAGKPENLTSSSNRDAIRNRNGGFQVEIPAGSELYQRI